MGGVRPECFLKRCKKYFFFCIHVVSYVYVLCLCLLERKNVMTTIHALYIYPVKSFRGIKVSNSVALAAGLQYDRQWLCVHPETGGMYTQRTVAKMAQVVCRVDDVALHLQFGAYGFTIAHDLVGDMTQATVWRDTVPAMVQDPLDDAKSIRLSVALTHFLQTPAQLVKFAPSAVRCVADDSHATVQFADGYPYTIADVADMRAVNAYLCACGQQPIAIERFRCNIVLQDCPADVGSHFRRFCVATANGQTVQGRFCTPCSRCPIPDLDPITGEKTAHNMRASLKKMRGTPTNWFATNSIFHIDTPITLSVGDKVTLI